jgi:hypothetical protein
LSEAELELQDKKDVIRLTRTRIEEGERKLEVLQSEKVERPIPPGIRAAAYLHRLDTPLFLC